MKNEKMDMICKKYHKKLSCMDKITINEKKGGSEGAREREIERAGLSHWSKQVVHLLISWVSIIFHKKKKAKKVDLSHWSKQVVHLLISWISIVFTKIYIFHSFSPFILIIFSHVQDNVILLNIRPTGFKFFEAKKWWWI